MMVLTDGGPDLRVADREEDLHAPVEITGHEVGTAKIHFLVSAVPEIIDPGVFEESPDYRGDPDILARPGIPGRRQQIPRTWRSIFTPACDARYRAAMQSGSTSAFILNMR